MKRIKYYLNRLIDWILFGKITEKIIDSIDGVIICEKAYIGRGGKTFGYWAYGYFDPYMPYPRKKEKKQNERLNRQGN